MKNILQSIWLVSILYFFVLPVYSQEKLTSLEKMKKAQLILEVASHVPRAERAFESAEGPGAYSQGGRGGRVLYVTRLEDDENEGSFRWAVEKQIGPRIVKFKVGGIISLNRDIALSSLDQSCLTIDGSDAPGKGITIKDGNIKCSNVHDIIIRHIRVRVGDEVPLQKGRWAGQKRKGGTGDAITIWGCAYVIIDHCSASWGSDEMISVTFSYNVTVQDCILSEPLANPELHSKKVPHAYGALMSGKNIAYIRNLICYFIRRGPQAVMGNCAIINNYVCFYENSGSIVKLTDYVEEGPLMHAIVLNNVYSNRLNPQAPDIYLFLKNPNLKPVGGRFYQIFIQGNIGPLRPSSAMNQWASVGPIFQEDLELSNIDFQTAEALVKKVRVEKPPFNVSPLTVLSTDQVANYVLDHAGATLPSRDAIDQRVVSQIKAGVGALINSQDEVGGYQSIVASDPDSVDVVPATYLPEFDNKKDVIKKLRDQIKNLKNRLKKAMRKKRKKLGLKK